MKYEIIQGSEEDTKEMERILAERAAKEAEAKRTKAEEVARKREARKIKKRADELERQPELF